MKKILVILPALLLGSLTVGPISPATALKQWRGLRAVRGLNPDRLSACAVTTDGRPVYFAGPQTAEGPRRLTFGPDGRVSLRGADERGQHMILRRLTPELINVFEFVDDTLAL